MLPNTFKIKLDLITPEGIEVCDDLTAQFIGKTDVTFKDPVMIKMRARKIHNDVAVDGEIRCTAVFSCARCLESFDHDIVKEGFFAYFANPHEENIDLTALIREDIIVSLPMKSLCKDDCKGLCSKCGQNLNQKQCGCDTAVFNIQFADLDRIKIKDKKKKK